MTVTQISHIHFLVEINVIIFCKAPHFQDGSRNSGIFIGLIVKNTPYGTITNKIGPRV